jgi:hypothetical protein
MFSTVVNVSLHQGYGYADSVWIECLNPDGFFPFASMRMEIIPDIHFNFHFKTSSVLCAQKYGFPGRKITSCEKKYLLYLCALINKAFKR